MNIQSQAALKQSYSNGLGYCIVMSEFLVRVQ